MPTVYPKDVINPIYLKYKEVDGQRFRARIVYAFTEKDAELKPDAIHVKFLCEVNSDATDDIYKCNQVLDFIECDTLDIEINTNHVYCFGCICIHQGP
jgi:hypothetical protein